MPIRPKHLEPGDTIGIIAPASAPPDPRNIDRSVAFIESLGFKAKLARHVRKRLGYLAGTDRERASDLMAMFTDRRVNAIICVRGGYGTARLLPLLEYQTIRAHPKIFVGYSDITSLHCAFLTKANLLTFHGPMLNSDFLAKNLPDFTVKSFLRTLTSTQSPGGISSGYRRKTVKTLRGGIVRGQLIGGNLTILCTTVGTPWQPPFRGRILFLEDVDEVPYRFERMLTHLSNCGLLQQVAGIAIGINANCEDPKARRTKEYRQTLEDILRDRLLPLKVPIVTGLPFGHVAHNATLPVGAEAVLDADCGELIFPRAAVQ